jgi:ribosome production factor 2
MNIVLGSNFNNKILDTFEFEVTNYIPIEHFIKDITINSGLKPIIIFQGDVFETDFQYDRMRKYFLDLFKINDIEEVNITELRRVVTISSGENKEIKIRCYQIDSFNEYNVILFLFFLV